MAKYLMTGGRQLKGKVSISGAKNSILPILVASLLTKEKCMIYNTPNLLDVQIMCQLMRKIGAHVDFDKKEKCISISTEHINDTTAPYELVNKMRASFLIMSALLARNGKAKISLPGGDAIGSRPVDLHLKGFEAMGASINESHGFVETSIKGKLKGSNIYLDFPSVGATENIMIAAALAKGCTIIENAATEPEIVDLSTFLISMGADIFGAGTDTIRINGVNELKGTKHSIIPDRIEAGTMMVAAAITNGDVIIENIIPSHLMPITAKLREAGALVEENNDYLRVKGTENIKAVDIKTHPYPGFPTDMQAQFTSLMLKAKGTSMVIETIFENRFMHINELKKMGAQIKIDGRNAIVEGNNYLQGAQVNVTDIRAGAALILAGLVAKEKTEIRDIFHIDRGYYKMHEKLKALGADIDKVE